MNKAQGGGIQNTTTSELWLACVAKDKADGKQIVATMAKDKADNHGLKCILPFMALL